MAAPRLRAAVIGLGAMGRRHLEAFALANVEVVALCDADSSTFARANAANAKTYTDWQSLLESEAGRIELLLTIATNGPTHHEIAIAAAIARVPFVLCEKPMATSGRKARAMALACAQNGTRLAVNMSRRYVDRFLRLKELVKDGKIGEVRHVNVSVGAGGLGCIGTHFFDLVAWLTDTRATWLVGALDENPEPNVRGAAFHDPGGRGMAGYANGMTASLQFSESVAPTPLIQLIGTTGYVDVNGWIAPSRGEIKVYARPHGEQATLKNRIEPRAVPFDSGPAMDVVDATARCIRDLLGEHREETVAAGIEAVDIVMAFHLSSARGLARIDLPLSGDDLDFDVPIT